MQVTFDTNGPFALFDYRAVKIVWRSSIFYTWITFELHPEFFTLSIHNEDLHRIAR